MELGLCISGGLWDGFKQYRVFTWLPGVLGCFDDVAKNTVKTWMLSSTLYLVVISRGPSRTSLVDQILPVAGRRTEVSESWGPRWSLRWGGWIMGVVGSSRHSRFDSCPLQSGVAEAGAVTSCGFRNRRGEQTANKEVIR
jgi:hypothetical protein